MFSKSKISSNLIAVFASALVILFLSQVKLNAGWWNFVDYSFNNGTAQVNYYEFDCPYRQIEVFMEMIWATDPNYDLGNDSEAIYKEATRKVLKKAAANNPGDIDTIAITIQDCWELLSDNSAMVPCDVDACCSATYHVTYDSQTDSYFADYQGMSGGTTNCTSPCENVCDTDYLWNDGQTALKQVFMDQYTDGLFEKFEIMPNPSKGSIKIKISGKERGNLSLSIYDINGNEVYKSGFNKSSEYVIYNLDLSSLSDGMYYIAVEINGKFEIKNKFMIIK